MKTIATKTKIVDHGNKIVLRDIHINDTAYTLEVTNYDGMLCFAFNGDEFVIQVVEGNLRFHRRRFRPTHDHNDIERLLRDDHGAAQWFGGSPVPERWAWGELPFGAVGGRKAQDDAP